MSMMARVRALRAAVLAMLVVVACAWSAQTQAAETQWWVANSAADHVKSEATGVLVDPDGVLRAAPHTEVFRTDSLSVAWSAAVLKDGSVVVGGDRGRVLRWTVAQGWKVFARLGSGQVLALAADGDGVMAGTGPRGLVYRIAANGDTTRFASTGERYVWALASAGNGAWWAATGTKGRLMRLTRGKAELMLDTEESNLTSLVGDGASGVYAGGDSRGRVYHHDGKVASTLFDAGEDEIRALARTADGSVYAAALSVSAAVDPTDADDGPQPVRSPISGGRAVVYRITPEGQAVSWWTSPQPLVFALLPLGDRLLASTGNQAGIQSIERAHGSALWFAPAAAQVTALAAGPRDLVYAVTSNPVQLVRLDASTRPGGTLRAAVLDARRFARFGRLRADASGDVSFRTRSGNSDTPDTTWSNWQSLGAEGTIGSPAARFLQWSAALGSADARVDEVAISYREGNLPPRIEDLSVAPQGLGFREGDMSQRTESITQTLATGQKVEYSATIGGAKALHEMPVWASGLRTLQWRGLDPNGDALKYRVYVRREPEGEWIEIGKDLEVSVLTWNTNTLADGRYRVRVVANDGDGNALGEALEGEATSEPFRIDRTAPVITTLDARPEGDVVRVTGRATDEGYVSRLDLSTDDGAWKLVSPEGTLADRPELRFDVRVPGLSPGTHLISLRALDAAGKATSRAVQVVVPKPAGAARSPR